MAEETTIEPQAPEAPAPDTVVANNEPTAPTPPPPAEEKPKAKRKGKTEEAPAATATPTDLGGKVDALLEELEQLGKDGAHGLLPQNAAGHLMNALPFLRAIDVATRQ